MRTISILVFIACFTTSIAGDTPHEFWRGLVFGVPADGVVGSN